MYKILLTVCVTTFFVVSQVAWSQSDGAQTGQLEFDVQPHVVIDRLNKALRSRVQFLTVDWGIEDNHLVISQVNPTLLDREFPHKIRFGENVSVELDSGAYEVSCVGFNLESNSKNLDKVLSKSAFFNLSVLRFQIAPGKTTTLEVVPEVHRHKTFTLQMAIPELRVRVIEDGVEVGTGLLCRRTETAVAWDDYSGPLKFRATDADPPLVTRGGDSTIEPNPVVQPTQAPEGFVSTEVDAVQRAELYSELERLEDLRNRGILTDEEFETLKQRALEED